jgi:hypothetical protein
MKRVTYAWGVGYRKEIWDINAPGLGKNGKKGALRGRRVSSYLALDVYFPEGSGTKALENSGSFSNLDSVGLDLDNILRTVGLEKFTTNVIVVEAKLVSEEAKRNISISTSG